MTATVQPDAATSLQSELVLVLDFGSQTAQLIARRIRDLNVFCQLVRHDISAERVKELAPRGIILSGGPASVYGEKHPNATRRFSISESPFSASATACN